MEKKIRSVSVTLTVIIFFAMALVGYFAGSSPAVCCQRALAGAIITYLVISISAKAIASIIINTIVENKVDHILENRNS
jgi:hypothetical protein